MMRLLTRKAIGVAALVVSMWILSAQAMAQGRPVPDTYLAVTTNMSPAGVELKADVLRWSEESDRRAVIAALSSEDDPAAGLRDLPTLGVVWRSGSAVGHSIKYATRVEDAEGNQTVTLVIDKAIGSTSFNPWTADNPTEGDPLAYSVIEMTVGEDTTGLGSMSLAAGVVIDSDAGTVSLAPTAGSPLLTDVRMAPKPYWAK
jgi:hypothetical protein